MLTKRQLIILDALIRLYTSTGQPIGSKTIMIETAIEASSATIRNELSQLEKLGFIQKTHSSSGRMPSLKGYRFYVDHLMQPQAVAKDKLKTMSEVFGNHVEQMDDIMYQSAQLLSDLTHYTAIVLGPKAETSRLTGFRLLALNDNHVMAIIQTDQGTIENKVFRMPGNIQESDLVKVTNIFNHHLVGHTLTEVAQKLQLDIPLLIRKYVSNATKMFLSIESAFKESTESRCHISGKLNILDFSENMNTQKLKSLYTMLDNSSDLYTLIDQINDDFVVKIGDEIDHELLKEFSLVTTTYNVSNYGKGVIAILGPTSMAYDETFGVLDVFRKHLTHTILEHYLE